MKLIGVLTALVVFTMQSYCQNDEGICAHGTWVLEDVEMTEVWDPIANTYVTVGETHYIYFYTGEDTLISGVSYHRLMFNEVNYKFESGDITPIYEEDYAFLFFRNTTEKLVYRRFENEVSESLWYDFNHEPGDYQTFTNIFNSNDFYLNSIDSVTWCDTLLRRHNYSLQPGAGANLTLIEELGTTKNFLWPYGVDIESDRLLFFCPSVIPAEDIQLEIIIGIDDPEQRGGSTLAFPNPHRDYFYLLNLPNGLSARAEIYNLQGKLMSDGINPYQQIDTGFLPSGQYFIRVFVGAETRVVSFIKE